MDAIKQLAEIQANERSLPQQIGQDTETEAPFIQCLADIEAKTVKFVWAARVPEAAITLMAGKGGSGKSTAAASLCANLTSGRALPGDVPREPMAVLLLAVEDDPAAVLRPRFEAHGADLKKVFFRNQVVMFNEPTLALLRSTIEEHSIRVVVIDPIVSFLNGRDANKAGDVRGLLNPLAELARDTGCAIIIVAHFNKNDSSSASNRISGSSDFRNAARSSLQVSQVNGQGFIALEKSNYAAQAKTLTFSIQNSRIVWQGESDLSADQVLAEENQARQESEGGTKVEAKEFLLNRLKFGAVAAKELQDEAHQMGISERTLFRAKKELEVEAVKVDNKWLWTLASPPKDSRLPSSLPQKVGSLGNVGSLDDENQVNFAMGVL